MNSYKNYITSVLKEWINKYSDKLIYDDYFDKNSVFVPCPNKDHRDRETKWSCSVNINNKSVPLGSFKCFGCGISGNFKHFQELIGVKDGYNPNGDFKSSINNDIELLNSYLNTIKEFDSNENNEDLLEIKLKNGKIKYVNVLHNEAYKIMTNYNREIPLHTKWRGIKSNILNKLYARLIFDEKTNQQYIFMPYIINNNLIGGTKFALKKSKNSLSYIDLSNSKKRNFLFPYDYTKRLIKSKNKNYVVLVEGQRDALSLLQHNIPALATLGTQNWEKNGDLYKISLLENLNIKYVFVMFDSDKAGIVGAKNVYKDLKRNSYFKIYNIKYSDSIKDPFDLFMLPDNVDKKEVILSKIKKITSC